jgi:TRAP-type uncharacterized transport system substrate-binding protein
MNRFLLALIACATLVLPCSAQEKVTISIATGPTGGVYYPMGGGMANILTKNVPGLVATAESTAGSVANLEFISMAKRMSRFPWRMRAGTPTKGWKNSRANRSR